MADERTQRDELEALQVETRALKAELALEHSPGFPEERARRERAAREAGEAEARAVATRDRLRHEKVALEARIFALTERLRVAEQRRLGLALVAVIPALWGIGVSMAYLRHAAHIVTPACGALLGLVLGPRVLRAVRGDTGQRVALGQVAADATVRNVGLLPMALAVAALGLPLFVFGQAGSRRVQLFEGSGGAFLALHLELIVASLAVVAARRGERLADAGRGTWRRLASSAGALAFLPLSFIFLAGAVSLSEADRFDPGEPGLAHALREVVRRAEALAMMAPAVLLLPWRLDGMLKPTQRLPWAWAFAALAAGVAALALVAATQSNAWPAAVDEVWNGRSRQWVPPPWHAVALAGWCALGAVLWVSRARETRRERAAATV